MSKVKGEEDATSTIVMILQKQILSKQLKHETKSQSAT